MGAIPVLTVRGDDDHASNSSSLSMSTLLITLLGIICFGLILLSILFLLRRRRQTQKASFLPQHTASNHKRLTIVAPPYSMRKSPAYVYSEKRDLLDNSDSPPSSPIPEIRVTFPDEEDKEGKRRSGRVVIVRIGETGSIGMEPVAEDQLPPYQMSDAERFQSLDLERIGGLKEKELR